MNNELIKISATLKVMNKIKKCYLQRIAFKTIKEHEQQKSLYSNSSY